MKSLEPRNSEDWDDGDRLAFALAGLQAVAGRALHEALLPGSRGWVDQYPWELASQLDFWVAKIRDIATVPKDGTPISELEINLRTFNALEAWGIKTVDDLRAISASSVLCIVGIGRLGLSEIRQALSAIDCHLDGDSLALIRSHIERGTLRKCTYRRQT